MWKMYFMKEGYKNKLETDAFDFIVIEWRLR